MSVNPRLRLVAALTLSFSIYLTPIFNLHAGWHPLGRMLASLDELSALSIAWICAALFMQLFAFLLIYWTLTGVRWWKLLALAAATPAFLGAANFGLLHAIPLAVLVDPDHSAEVGELEFVCSIGDAEIAQVLAGADLSLVRSGEVRLVDTQQFTLATLKMPGCTVTGVNPPTYGSTIDPVAPGGHVLHRKVDGEVRHVNLVTGVSRPVAKPRDMPNWAPILSDDGMIAAWLERRSSDSTPIAHRLRTRKLDSGQEREIALDFAARDQLQLIGARTGIGPYTIARHRNAIFSVDQNGAILSGPISPEHIYDARWGFQWVESGWVSWDGYREDGQSRVVWKLSTGEGSFAVPRGRDIESLSVAEDGRTIGISFSSNISIGDVLGAIVLFRTSDGAEIYRRNQPRFSRAKLAFIHSDYLAIERYEDSRARVEVFRAPPPKSLE